MKKLLTPAAIAFSIMLLFSGCVASLGGGTRNATVGQQLIDLQKARNSGAITESEYQVQKTKLLRK